MNVKTATVLKVYAGTFFLLLLLQVALAFGESGLAVDEAWVRPIAKDVASYTNLAAGAFFGALSTLMDKGQRPPYGQEPIPES